MESSLKGGLEVCLYCHGPGSKIATMPTSVVLKVCLKTFFFFICIYIYTISMVAILDAEQCLKVTFLKCRQD